MPRKARLAIQRLSNCGGCEDALGDLGTYLLRLLDDQIELVYSAFYTGAKDYGDVDIVLLVGAAHSEDDLASIEKARARARYVVCYGSCTVFGGFPGMGNLYGVEELERAAFVEAPSAQRVPPTAPKAGVPRMVDLVKPVEDYVRVDFLLPGCPPPPDMTADVLEAALRQARAREG